MSFRDILFKDIAINKTNFTQKPKRKFKLSKRGPYLLVLIIALLTAVGIEITNDLGWLSAQDWLNDIYSLLVLIAAVILIAVVCALMFLSISRRLKKRKSAIDWDNINNESGNK